MIGTVLATPYSLDYDLMVLAPAIAYPRRRWLAPRLRALTQKTLLAVLWLMPLIARSVAAGDADSARRARHAAGVSLLLRRAIDGNRLPCGSPRTQVVADIRIKFSSSRRHRQK